MLLELLCAMVKQVFNMKMRVNEPGRNIASKSKEWRCVAEEGNGVK